ncbi:hypothetical protein [Enterovirga aerilata]|uniref:Uncharacterized protein n=1 Tax=Enterovirga aerilata TaxID=2730920 RepID=A0A849I2I1_9HYPH|nr:hypothetical protein [Enterovirga sp. DB1703]NNM71834.1 hypothetical protein [Enterovirga sp. DB1703]
MRLLMLAGVIGLALPAPGAMAQTSPPRAAKPASSAAEAQPAPTPGDVNAAARRAEEERHKRWNERMRRATRSLCDGC